MAGYTPWMAGAAAAAKRANDAALARHIEKLRGEWREYRAEARACGYDAEGFEEWLGEDACRQLGLQVRTARRGAEARIMDGRSYAEWHHTADLY